MEKAIFARKKLNIDRLRAYGFVEATEGYAYATDMLNGQFQMHLFVAADGQIQTQLIDTTTGDEYTLHRVAGASGAFVGGVKEAYMELLQSIAEKCFEPDVFKTAQAGHIIEYVRSTYGDELEFLWQRFPDNAVFRRKDNGKWYAALLRLHGSKLGLPVDEVVEILDLRLCPEEMEATVDHVHFFPGYHMNKKHWYTICLNESVPMGEILRRIDTSYQLAER